MQREHGQRAARPPSEIVDGPGCQSSIVNLKSSIHPFSIINRQSEIVNHPRHLLGLEGLRREELLSVIDEAERLLPVAMGREPRLDDLRDRVVANLFFEDSTRTRCSFTLATVRLGGQTFDLAGEGSSVRKGETLIDTARNLATMGVDAMVIRSGAAGAAAMVARVVECPVINAGDGRHEHPTQALLDLMTMRQRLGDVAGRTIAIVGDIAGSRVARSNIHALVTMGATVHLIGPPTLAPKSFERIAAGSGRVIVGHDLDAVLDHVDAIMMLRVQFERGSGVSGDYRQLYALTPGRAVRLKPGAFIMHPGPINRGLELDDEVADDPVRSVILQQVANGVAVRMAVLRRLICRG